jgi:hypothetical protein
VRAFYRECVDGLPRFHGMHRFLPTLVAMSGWRITELDVNHRRREHGKTSYGVHNRLWVGIADTLGVRWLSSRSIKPSVAEASEDADGDAVRAPQAVGECRSGDGQQEE